jgi:ABC-type multidrug transport system fused ATPase/permease subunit
LTFIQLLRIVTPPAPTLAGIIAVLLLSTLAVLAQPWLAGQVTAQVVGQPADWKTTVGGLMAAWLGLVALRNALTVVSSTLIGSTGARMTARLRGRAYAHAQALPLAWHHDRRCGDTLALITQDTQVISQFVSGTLVGLLPMLLTFFGAFGMMLWLDATIAALIVLAVPLFILVSKLLGRSIRPQSARWMEAQSRLTAFTDENLRLMPIIKAFVREPVEQQRFREDNNALLNATCEQVRAQAIMGPAINLLASVSIIGLFWLGISHVESGQLSSGGLVSLMLYGLLMAQPVSGFASVYGQVQLVRGASQRLQAFFAQAQEVDTALPDLPAGGGAIEFRNLHFAYPGRSPVFTAFNLQVAAGETIALTGPNGVGKSTLAHLLLRYIDPDQGQVIIDGTDLSSVNHASVRRAVGLVSQHTLLLNGTVRENLLYAKPDATAAEAEAAARVAGAVEFIAQLPNGYDTIIGDQGIKLSGGQRQRLSLARTLLLQPRILILDEATAMFDPQGEADFIERSRQLLATRTVILITHRPASLELADRVVPMPALTNKP